MDRDIANHRFFASSYERQRRVEDIAKELGRRQRSIAGGTMLAHTGIYTGRDSCLANAVATAGREKWD